MAAKFLFVTIACLFFAINVNGLQTVNGRIKITIQTTAGCGDTVRFIRDQLAPTYESYGNFLDVEFVPWGRASRLEDGTLVCQFGASDCWANRLHRCALNMLKGNQDAKIHYMTCENTTPFPSFIQGSYLCAHAVGLSLVEVDYCVANPGDELDLADEIKGNALTAAINFIPSIVFNDAIDIDEHNQSLNGLESMVCFALAADPSTGITGCVV